MQFEMRLWESMMLFLQRPSLTDLPVPSIALSNLDMRSARSLAAPKPCSSQRAFDYSNAAARWKPDALAPAPTLFYSSIFN